jgi:hypothetical protein
MPLASGGAAHRGLHLLVVVSTIGAAVAAQLRIAVALMRGQQLGRCEVILQMDGTQLALRLGDLRRQGCQTWRRDFPPREGLIERPFALDQLLADRQCFSLHGIGKLAHLLPLPIRKLKLVSQFEHVYRARIAVQLGSKRQAHATTGAKVGKLLIAERLDGTLLKSCVGRVAMLMLRQSKSAHGKDGEGCKSKSHRALL